MNRLDYTLGVALIVVASNFAGAQEQMDFGPNSFQASSWDRNLGAGGAWTLPVTISQGQSQNLVVSSVGLSTPPQGAHEQRTFEIQVTHGDISQFDFTYHPESEIEPIAVVLTGPNGSLSYCSLTPNALNTCTITTAQIMTLFGASTTALSSGSVIVVTEFFNVIQCSATTDSTVYGLENWTCTSTTPPCNTSTYDDRAIRVDPSVSNVAIGMMVNNIPNPPPAFPPPIDVCGAPSDILIRIANSGCPTGFPPDSCMKTLRQITFQMKQDVFSFFPPQTAIVLEDAQGNQVPVSAIPNFYSFAANLVTLNFDTLTPNNAPAYFTAISAFAAWPLVNGFIPEGQSLTNPNLDVHNELGAGRFFYLRFIGAEFDCQNAQLYQNFGLADCKDEFQTSPYNLHLFFGDGNGGPVIQYENMCGTPVSQPSTFGSVANNFAVTTIGQADRTDVQVGSSTQIDFFWRFSGARGDPNNPPSPFNFGNLGVRPWLFFNCTNVTYQITVSVPTYFVPTVNSTSPLTATYFPDPNSATPDFTLSPISSSVDTIPTPGGNCDPAPTLSFNVYTYTHPTMTFDGRLTIDVKLDNCPTNCGDFTTITAEIQAICDSCSACPYTVGCTEVDLFYHCLGGCVGPPQQTNDFTFDRVTLGWTDGTLLTKVDPTLPAPRIWTNRSYNCDEILVTSTGAIDADDLDVCNLGYLIQYEPGVNFQFFEEAENANGDIGTLRYGGITTQSLQPIHLSHQFASAGTWPTTQDANGMCSLWVNFPQAWLTDIQQNFTGLVTLELTLNVKVKSTLLALGYYNIGQIRGGYVSGSTPNCLRWEESCDTWGDNQLVQDVTIQPDFQVFPANGANFDAYGWANATGVCERRFVLGTFVRGGLPGLDHFLDEFRPPLGWRVSGPLPGSLSLPFSPSLTLPLGVDFVDTPPTPSDCYSTAVNSAEFSVVGHPDWMNLTNGVPIWFPVQTQVSQAFGQTVVTFLSYGLAGSNHPPLSNWPLLDADGNPVVMYIRGTVTNECPAECFTQLNPPGPCPHPIGDAELNFPFIRNFYAPFQNPTDPNYDPLCYSVHPATASNPQLLEYRTAPDVTLTVATDVVAPAVTSSPFRIPGITYEVNAWGNARVSGAWIQVVGLQITSVERVNANNVVIGTFFPDANGYVCFGDVAHGFVNRARLTLIGTLTPGCVPPNPINVEIRYGYSCVGSPPSSCEDSSSLPFNVIPGQSAISIGPITVDTSSGCTHVYTVRLNSTLGADVNQPRLQITLPFGMKFAGPTAYTRIGSPAANCTAPPTGVLALAPPAATSVTWDIGAAAYCGQGMPPFPASVEVHFVVAGCATAGDPINFDFTGEDICGNPLAVNQTHLPAALDSTPPMIVTCPPNLTIQCGASTDPTATGFATATDNCEPPTVTYEDIVEPCDMGETVITRTWTATDLCRNQVCCVQQITVQNVIPPDLVCPGVSFDLGINPPVLPTCATALAQVTGFVGCGTLTCSAGPIIVNGSTRTQIFTVTPTIDCGTPGCDVIYAWEELDASFLRGDVDSNGTFNGLVDALFLLYAGFVPGMPQPPCLDAADANGNGQINHLADGLYILNFQFLGGPPPPPPFPNCGASRFLLGCERHACF